jgi:hypothetical protein
VLQTHPASGAAESAALALANLCVRNVKNCDELREMGALEAMVRGSLRAPRPRERERAGPCFVLWPMRGDAGSVQVRLLRETPAPPVARRVSVSSLMKPY